MAVHYAPRWTVLDSYNATTPLNPILVVNVGSSGYESMNGGYLQHTVTSRGTVLHTFTPYRSYHVSSYRQTAGVWALVTSAQLDVFGVTADATAMNTFLTNMSNGDLLVLSTADEPAGNKSYFDTNLRDNFGAQLATNAFEGRSMYALVSIKGQKRPIYERYERRAFLGISATIWLG